VYAGGMDKYLFGRLLRRVSLHLDQHPSPVGGLERPLH
jgi:hypothetical protein